MHSLGAASPLSVNRSLEREGLQERYACGGGVWLSN